MASPNHPAIQSAVLDVARAIQLICGDEMARIYRDMPDMRRSILDHLCDDHGGTDGLDGLIARLASRVGYSIEAACEGGQDDENSDNVRLDA